MRSKPRKRRRTIKNRKRPPYTLGDINKLIDGLIQPLAEKEKSFILVDGLLHLLIERNPPQSLRKFIKYNLPGIVKKMEKRAKELEHALKVPTLVRTFLDLSDSSMKLHKTSETALSHKLSARWSHFWNLWRSSSKYFLGNR